MPKKTWDTAAEWDNAASEDGVVHQSVTNTDHDNAAEVKQGYDYASLYNTGSEHVVLPLHEDSGSTAYDFSGKNNDATNNSASVGNTGILGTTGYGFNPSNSSYLESPAGLGADDLTVMAWIRPQTKSNSNYQSIMMTADSAGGLVRFSVGPNLDQISFIARSGKGILGHSYSFTAGELYHVAGVHDASSGNWTIYVNGTSEASVSGDGSYDRTDTNMGIGARLTDGALDGNHYDGDMMYFRVDLTPWSSSEIQHVYDVVRTSGSLITGGK